MSVLPRENKNVKINIHLQQKIQQRLSLAFSINSVDKFMTTYDWNTRNEEVALSEKTTSIWSWETNKMTVNKLITEDKLLDELCSQLLAEENMHSVFEDTCNTQWWGLQSWVANWKKWEGPDGLTSPKAPSIHRGAQKLNTGLLFWVKKVFFLSLKSLKYCQIPVAGHFKCVWCLTCCTQQTLHHQGQHGTVLGQLTATHHRWSQAGKGGTWRQLSAEALLS